MACTGDVSDADSAGVGRNDVDQDPRCTYMRSDALPRDICAALDAGQIRSAAVINRYTSGIFVADARRQSRSIVTSSRVPRSRP